MFFGFIGIGHSNHLVWEKQISKLQKLDMGLSDFVLFVSGFVWVARRGAGGYSKRRTGVNPRLYWIAKIASRGLEDARISRIAEG